MLCILRCNICEGFFSISYKVYLWEDKLIYIILHFFLPLFFPDLLIPLTHVFLSYGDLVGELLV